MILNALQIDRPAGKTWFIYFLSYIKKERSLTLPKSQHSQNSESKDQIPDRKDEKQANQRPKRNGFPPLVHRLGNIVSIFIGIVLHTTNTWFILENWVLGGRFGNKRFLSMVPL